MADMEKDKIEAIKKWLGTGSIDIFGRSFAGKDTQCRELAKLLDGAFLSGGEILRNSTLPTSVREKTDSGYFTPNDVYNKTVLPHLYKPEFKNKALILSSFGRWHDEEDDVLRVAKESGHELKATIYLHIDENIVWQRWNKLIHTKDRGERADDTQEALKNRLEEFKDKTMPVLDFYRKDGILIEINGNQSSDAVTEEIINKLYEFSRI